MAKEVIGKGWITVAAINDGQPGPLVLQGVQASLDLMARTL